MVNMESHYTWHVARYPLGDGVYPQPLLCPYVQHLQLKYIWDHILLRPIVRAGWLARPYQDVFPDGGHAVEPHRVQYFSKEFI
jgi:hypothetical protein